MYKSVVTPSMLQGWDSQMLNAREEQKIDVMKTKYLKSIYGGRRINMVRNKIIKGRYKSKLSLLEIADIGC